MWEIALIVVVIVAGVVFTAYNLRRTSPSPPPIEKTVIEVVKEESVQRGLDEVRRGIMDIHKGIEERKATFNG